MKQQLERNIAMTFRVTVKERDLIRKAQKLSGINNLRAYLLKQAVNGRIISVNIESVDKMNQLLANTTSNINQIARRINSTGNIYQIDIEEIKNNQDEIYQQQKEILRSLYKILNSLK